MIQVADVDVELGDLPVLNGVSLAVEAGRFVGLVGPNGAGKTTLLRTINGVLEPDAGRVTVDGTDVHSLSSRRASRLIATVPQDTHLAFEFTVRDVVEMGRTPYRSRFGGGGRDDRDVVERALERTETGALSDRSVDAISGGERQRVLLARAFAQDTPVLLLDEPTASLDINHQVHTLELVSDSVREGTTAVAAIHDLDLAARYCDELVLLAEGGVREAGPPDEVLTAGTLEDAFGATAAVTPDPVTGAPSVTALADGRSDGPDVSAHVVGDGGLAARVLAELVTGGVSVTAGVLSRGSVAAAAAAALDVEAVTRDPFRPLTPEDRREMGRLVDRADVAVVAGVSDGERREIVDGSGTEVVGVDPPTDRQGRAHAEANGGEGDRPRRVPPARVVDAVRRAAASETPTSD